MKRAPIIAGVTVAALAVGGIVYASTRPTTTITYVTATSSKGSVTQTFAAAGTVDRSGRADLTFDTPGLVTAVPVKVGDQVKKGQALASVDQAPLRASLLQSQATLAQAQAALDADQTALDNGGTPFAMPTASATGAGMPAGTSGMSGADATTPSAASTPAYITELQASMKELQDASTAQQSACAPVYEMASQAQGMSSVMPSANAIPSVAVPSGLPSGVPTGVPTGLPSGVPTSLPSGMPSALPSGNAPTADASGTPAQPTATTSPTGSPTATTSPTGSTPSTSTTSAGAPGAAVTMPTGVPTAIPSGALPSIPADQVQKAAGQLQKCSQSMTAMASAEQKAGAAIVTASTGMQQATTQAQAQLVAAQEAIMAQAQAAGAAAAQEAMAQAQAQLAAQPQRAMGGKVTDATIASDRARLLQAQQGVDKAQRNLDEATMVAPTDGTVGAIALTAGQSSAGGSITLIGPGTATVPVEIPLTVRGLVAAGQDAHVGVVGTDADLTGSVSEVSVVPSSGSGSPTYTAKVVVDDPQQRLLPGSSAEVTLTLRSASDVVTVPVSAVTKTSDTTGTVQVVANGTATSAETVAVTTGTVGGGRIELTSGLPEGKVVVLADRRLPVPGGLSQYQQSSPSASPKR